MFSVGVHHKLNAGWDTFKPDFGDDAFSIYVPSVGNYYNYDPGRGGYCYQNRYGELKPDLP
jgi:hypothetical protein